MSGAAITAGRRLALAALLTLGGIGLMARNALADAPAAAASDRPHKLLALMEASGVSTRLRELIEASLPQVRAQGESILKTNLRHMRPDAGIRDRLLAAEARFEQAAKLRLQTVLTDNVWLREYDRAFSDGELDQLLAFYTSPLHVRERALDVADDSALRNSIEQVLHSGTAELTQDFVREVRALTRECDCREPAPAAAAPAPPATH